MGLPVWRIQYSRFGHRSACNCPPALITRWFSVRIEQRVQIGINRFCHRHPNEWMRTILLIRLHDVYEELMIPDS